MKAQRMAPETAIESLPEMLKGLNAIRAHLADEADEIGERWEGLGMAGGQRGDHAASLLSRLRPHLEELERWARTCREQIEVMARDPFGREE